MFTELFAALKDNAPVAVLALVLLAFGWYVRDSRRRDEEHAKQLQALNDAQRLALEAQFKEHLETAMQVIPLATKLASCIELVERVVANRGLGGA